MYSLLLQLVLVTIVSLLYSLLLLPRIVLYIPVIPRIVITCYVMLEQRIKSYYVRIQYDVAASPQYKNIIFLHFSVF